MKNKFQTFSKKAESFLFASYSTKRSVFMLICLFILYVLTFFLFISVYHKVFTYESRYYVYTKYLFIFYNILFAPVFVLIGFKLNTLTSFWKDMSKPKLFDYLFVAAIIVLCYVSFNHGDITVTACNGKSLVDLIAGGGSPMNFYDFNEGTAAYLFPQYILFGIWSVPVKVVYWIMGLAPIGVNEFARIDGLTLWWYKLLPTIFYLGSAFVIYKIGRLLKLSANKSKWMSFIWVASPISVFSQFVFGQYDSVGVFFELLMVYFFLQKKTMKFSMLAMVAMTFKMFPILIFIPLLLLIEKNIFKIAGHMAVALSGYFTFNFIFSGSSMFAESKNFNNSMFERLYSSAFSSSFGNVSFFFAAFTIACVFAYFVNVNKLDDFAFQKYTLYIPLFIYSFFTMFILWHPQWILMLMPYVVMNVFVNCKIKKSLLVMIASGLMFILVVMANWYENVDANLANRGIFKYVFNIHNSSPNFRSLTELVSLQGKIPPTIYMSVFAAILIAVLIKQFPAKSNIESSSLMLKKEFNVPREIIWINALVIMAFAAPSLLLLFSNVPK